MSSEGKKLAIGVFCADWRLHQEEVNIISTLKNYLHVDGVDVLAIPGPDGLCGAVERKGEQGMVAEWLKLLAKAHHSSVIAFMAHYNCAGHSVTDEEHDAHSQEMLETYKKLTGFTGEMVALCAIHESDTNWPLKEIARIPAEAVHPQEAVSPTLAIKA